MLFLCSQVCLLGFYCCVEHYHELSILSQRLLPHNFCWSRVWVYWFLCKATISMLSRTGFPYGVLAGDGSFSNFIQAVSRTFLTMGGLRSQIPSGSCPGLSLRSYKFPAVPSPSGPLHRPSHITAAYFFKASKTESF